MSGAEQRPELSLPKEGQEPFSPRFSFTREIQSRFQEASLTPEQYGHFVRSFDSYLGSISEREGLLALAVLAIPSTDDLTKGFVTEGGFALDAIGYWASLKDIQNRDDLDYEWSALGEKPINSWEKKQPPSAVLPIFFQHTSTKDYPTLEEFRHDLDDTIQRREFTVTNADCEFWGLVTTEQIRKEMKTP